jgi:LCP family protein required for cell wall assembly
MGQSAVDSSTDAGEDAEDKTRDPAPRGLARALGLTLASAVVWGVAHISAGRRAAGIALMSVFVILIGGAAFAAIVYRSRLKHIAVSRDWLAGVAIGILVLALLWALIVIRSYQVVRPRGLRVAPRLIAGTLVTVLTLVVCAPLVWAARDAYTLRDTISTIFHADNVKNAPAPVINATDPWKDKPRINILLIGGDYAKNRIGTRTDSMTVASIDTHTGDTVLLSLPRNLQDFPMLPRLRSRWPDGFTGVGSPGDQGLLNELYQDAEDDPSLVPGFKKGRRGAQLVSEEISYLIGQPIDYYVMVNLFGFADIVDAIGGVLVHIPQDIPFGGPEDGSAPAGVLKAGDRVLDGKQALWFGRSRTASSDFVRMGRQKCLMKDIAEQANPSQVLIHFEKLASAAKKTIATNIPASLLPALVDLSGSMKRGAQITSLMYVPPEFHVVRPQLSVMHRAAARAIAESEQRRAGSATSTAPTPSAAPSTDPAGGRTLPPHASNSNKAHASPTPSGSESRAISLSATCG